MMLALMLAPPPAPVRAATQVSYPEPLREVRSGPLIRAVINPTRGDIEIKFRNLSEWEAFGALLLLGGGVLLYRRRSAPALAR